MIQLSQYDLTFPNMMFNDYTKDIFPYHDSTFLNTAFNCSNYSGDRIGPNSVDINEHR